MNKIIRHALEKDIPEIIEVIEKSFIDAFGEINEQDAIETARTFEYYYRFSEYRPEDIVVIEIDGNIVSFAGAIELPIEKEDFHIKAAQINPVATLQEYRNNGLASECINYLCDYLKNKGYSILYLCGHPNYYTRFGFNQVFTKYIGRINVDNTRNIETSYSIEKAELDKTNKLIEIYNRVKSNNLFKVNMDNKWTDKKILLHKEGNVPFCTVDVKDLFFVVKTGKHDGYAYISNHGESLVVEGFKALNRESAFSLLKGLGEIAEERGKYEIIIDNVIPDEILYNIVIDLGGKIEIYKNTPNMLKILSAGELLTSMSKIFNKRINSSKFHEAKFHFIIECEGKYIEFTKDKKLEVRITDNSKMVDNKQKVVISYDILAYLVAGYRSIYELIEEGKCNNFEEEINKILAILFPKHNPYVEEIFTI